MTPHQPDPTQRPSRRGFLELMGGGLYGAALSTLLGRDLGARTPGADDHAQPSGFGPRQPHFAPRARSVIQLFMNGGPSQMDLFDPKPELDRNHGKSYFDQIAGEVENPLQAGKLMRCPYRFAQHGESGMWVSEVMPHLATQVDRIAFIRSMHTTNITHEPALYKIHSGRMLPGLPSMGSWITWGLGSESQNLPAYVVLDDPLGLPINGHQSWQAGFLPPQYQGTRFRTRGEPVLDLQPDYEEPAGATRVERALLSELDRLHVATRTSVSETPPLQERTELFHLTTIDPSLDDPSLQEATSSQELPSDSLFSTSPEAAALLGDHSLLLSVNSVLHRYSPDDEGGELSLLGVLPDVESIDALAVRPSDGHLLVVDGARDLLLELEVEGL